VEFFTNKDLFIKKYNIPRRYISLASGSRKWTKTSWRHSSPVVVCPRPLSSTSSSQVGNILQLILEFLDILEFTPNLILVELNKTQTEVIYDEKLNNVQYLSQISIYEKSDIKRVSRLN
jgi:hypothetical protein